MRKNSAGGILRTPFAVLLAAVLGIGFGVTTIDAARGTEANPLSMVEQFLQPAGKTVARSGKQDLLDAVCQAVKRHRTAAPQIARATAEARPEHRRAIFETAFRCLPDPTCDLLDDVLETMTTTFPEDAATFSNIAVDLARDCASVFGHVGVGEGVYDQGPPSNLQPPGSIGGVGGGQGNVVAICHNGRTIFVSPQGAQGHLRQHAGDSAGPCQVTPTTNR